MNICTKNRKYLCFLLLIIVLAAAYFPVTRGYYLMEDDYWTFLDRHKSISTNMGVKSQALDAARPLGALINYSSLKYVRGISDLNYVRLGALSVVCICCCLLFSFMTSLRGKIPLVISFATSAIVFLTSSFQSNVLKVFEINSLVGTLIAIYASIRGIQFINSNDGRNPYAAHAKIFALLVIILITYTHSITFYWFPLFIYLCMMSVPDFYNKRIRIITVFIMPLLSMALFALFYRIFLVKSPSQSLLLGLSQYSEKIKWFFLSALPVGIDIPGILTSENYIQFGKELSISFNSQNIILILILLSSIVGFLRFVLDDIKSVTSTAIYRKLAMKYLVVASVIFLSISPLFFSSEPTTCYRRFTAMQAILAFLGLYGIYSLLSSFSRIHRGVVNGVLLLVVMLMVI